MAACLVSEDSGSPVVQRGQMFPVEAGITQFLFRRTERLTISGKFKEETKLGWGSVWKCDVVSLVPEPPVDPLSSSLWEVLSVSEELLG